MTLYTLKFRFDNREPITMDVFSKDLESAVNKAESIIPISIRNHITMFEEIK